MPRYMYNIFYDNYVLNICRQVSSPLVLLIFNETQVFAPKCCLDAWNMYPLS